MARPIDEKIVAMRLDNSDFKQKAAETVGLFGKLRNALNVIPGVNLGKTTKELSAIGAETEKIPMEKLGSAIQTVANRFTNLGIVGAIALQNITNRAIDAGINLAKSLSIDQVIAGFQEYELKMGSIRTILANTEHEGATLEDVKSALEDLNEYADLTIYNFGQMTENIGRFTAAGVGLEDSTIAIKGMSNMAAVSGSNVHQLNTAMYQMSQMLAAGKMNLMDWNSLVNAGMGGKIMQDALMETAKAMGINIDMSEGFRESLKHGWLTADVFVETMKKFAEDESMIEAATKVRTFSQLIETVQESLGSGWGMTFEHIFGDFEEATELFSGLADIITGWVDRTSDARNEFVGAVADAGGFLNIFEGIGNALKPIGQIFVAIGDAFRKVFPPKTVEQVVSMTESFKEFTAGLTLSESTVEKLTAIFQGFFSVTKASWEIVKQLGLALLNLIPEGIGGHLLNLFVGLGELAIGMKESVEEGNLLTRSIQKLGDVLGLLGGWIGTAISAITDFGGSVRDTFGAAIDWLREKLAPVKEWFKEAFGGFGTDEVLGGGVLVGLFFIVRKAIDMFSNFSGIFGEVKKGLSEGLSGIGENIKGVFEGLGDAIESFQEQVKYNNLLKIAIAVGILAVSLKLLEGIKTEDIVNGIAALAGSLGAVIGGMAIMDKFDIVGGMRAATTLIAISIAVSIMAGALKKIADLNPGDMIKGVAGLVGITGALAGAVIAISRLGGKIGASSLQLIALSTAVYILAGALNKIAEIDGKSLVKSIAAMGVLFAELVLFLKIANGSKLGPGSAIGLIAVAGAIQIMVSAIERISNIDVKSLIKGLGTIGVLLLEIGLFSKLASGATVMGAGVGILLLSVALNAMVKPIQSLGGMSWTELTKGLGGMAVALVSVGLAAKVASRGIGGAVAITLIATALNLLMVPIKAFSKMSWGSIIKSFVGLAGSMTVVAVAAMLLSPAVIPMLAFGGAVSILGTAMYLAGAGIALFGTGLATLAGMTAVSIASIISGFRMFIEGLGEIIGSIVNFGVQVTVGLIEGFMSVAPLLIESAIGLIMMLLETIEENIQDFIVVGIQIILNILDGLSEKLPDLIDAGFNLIVEFIVGMTEAVRENGPLLVDAVMGLLGEIIILFINAGLSVINALFGWIPGVKEASTAIGSTAEDYIRDNFGALELGEEKGVDFADSLEGQTGLAEAASVSIGDAVTEALSEVDLWEIGINVGKSFINGIGSMAEDAWEGAWSLGKKAVNGLKKALGINSPSKEGIALGGWYGEGFLLGISSKEDSVDRASRSMAERARDAVNSLLDTILQPDDDEIKIKAVLEYDKFDPDGFGPTPVAITPDTSFTNSQAHAARIEKRQNDYIYRRDRSINNEENNPVNDEHRQPAVFQFVTPDKRELARWMVDDITEFQKFNLRRLEQF